MRTFLLFDNQPVLKWGQIPPHIMFKGKVPQDFDLAVSMDDNYVILDVDVKGSKNGFDHIPKDVLDALNETFNYKTKSGGSHFWIQYRGNKKLLNRATKFGLDLRTSDGYVKYPLKDDPVVHLDSVKHHSIIDEFLESLFSSEVPIRNIKSTKNGFEVDKRGTSREGSS